MSEQDFKQARQSLALSASILDKMRAQNMAQQSPVMGQMPQQMQEEPQDSPEMVPEQPMQEEAPAPEEAQKGVVESVVEAIKPYFEDIKEMFVKKEEEPKDAVLKIDATVEESEEKKE